MRKIPEILKKKRIHSSNHYGQYRDIHVLGGVWKWCKRGSTIMIVSPAWKKYTISESDFTGISHEELSRGAYKGYYVGIETAQVKRYIMNTIWGTEYPQKINIKYEKDKEWE